jgi:hypothetical protein
MPFHWRAHMNAAFGRERFGSSIFERSLNVRPAVRGEAAQLSGQKSMNTT